MATDSVSGVMLKFLHLILRIPCVINSALCKTFGKLYEIGTTLRETTLKEVFKLSVFVFKRKLLMWMGAISFLYNVLTGLDE